jgi:hypothetical protein
MWKALYLSNYFKKYWAASSKVIFRGKSTEINRF